MVRNSIMERSYFYYRSILVGKSIKEKVTSSTETIMVRKSIMQRRYLCKKDVHHGEESTLQQRQSW